MKKLLVMGLLMGLASTSFAGSNKTLSVLNTLNTLVLATYTIKGNENSSAVLVQPGGGTIVFDQDPALPIQPNGVISVCLADLSGACTSPTISCTLNSLTLKYEALVTTAAGDPGFTLNCKK